MNKLPWMKYDPDIVSMDVDGMTLEEEGAYSRCVRHLWRNGPLPEARLSRLCGPAWEAVKPCMEEYADGFSFSWLEDARASAKNYQSQRSQAGSISAEKRKTKRTTVERPLNDRSTTVQSISSSSSNSPETVTDKLTGEQNARAKATIPFEPWWQLYRKGSRKLSAEQWERLSDADRQACMAATPAYLGSKPDPIYRKDGERFLRHRTWEDPIVTPQPTQPNGLMTKEQARLELKMVRERLGIAPGGVIETHMIPEHIRKALAQP